MAKHTLKISLKYEEILEKDFKSMFNQFTTLCLGLKQEAGVEVYNQKRTA